MNLDQGKMLFDTFLEADSVAKKMMKKHHEGYEPYKVGVKWAVGGVHIKKHQKSKFIKSMEELGSLFEDYRTDEAAGAIDDYIADVSQSAETKESSTQGGGAKWLLISVDVLRGCDIGMSPSNSKQYLVLSLQSQNLTKKIKMGGAFERHIPLVRRQAIDLIGKPLIWYTWNNKSSSWSDEEWFYLIEQDSTK